MAAARALAFLHGASGSLSVRSVVAPDCVTLKMPSEKRAFCGGAPAAETELSSTTPAFVSTVEPIGIVSPAASAWHGLPFGQTFTVPLTGWTPTVCLNCGGGGVGVGVAGGVGVGVGDGGHRWRRRRRRVAVGVGVGVGTAPTVNDRLAGTGSGLPPSSRARTSNVCGPLASGGVVYGDVQGLNGALSTRQSKLVPDFRVRRT